MSSSKTTTDHETIKSWVEARGGAPAVVATTHEEEGTGVLRINFPEYSGEDSLEEIEWDEFFEIFDDRNLQFLYQEETKDGGESRFFKFVAGSEERSGKGNKRK